MADQENIKKNSIISLMSLFFHSGYAAVLGLVANFILTVVLTPKVYGIYVLTLAIIPFLNFFSDIGLAASLVQKKEVSDDDIKTTFTIQQSMILTVIIIAFFLTPFIRDFYHLPTDATYLYWAVLGSFFLSSLKTIPSIKLERSIQFQKIVLVQIVESTIFYATISILALMGFGLQTFTIAVLVRSLSGTILMYSLSFWIPQFGISRTSLKTLLSFGVPFQTNTFLSLIKDDLILFYLGRVVGLEGLAYIGWAKRWAESPIRIIMDNVSKILFPVFARIQTEKERVGLLIGKVLKLQTMILAPIFVGMSLLLHEVVQLIPKYNKWEIAIPLFYIIAVSAFFSSYSTPFTNLFNAVGKVKTTFKFMLYWTVMSWISIPLFTHLFGLYGYPISLVILSLTFVVIIPISRRIVDFEFLPNVVPAIVSSLIMGVAVYFTTLGAVNWLNIAISIGVGMIIYILSLRVLFKVDILKDIKTFVTYE
ncbi:oligosaccharide flippase family protein [Candidatus Woesebacteria bacterium]|nr:oligosaccharide flippase family protein [Candidatus Woesebacteria bacterium]